MPSYIYCTGHSISGATLRDSGGMGCTILLILKHPIFDVGGQSLYIYIGKIGYFICGEHASILINVVEQPFTESTLCGTCYIGYVLY